MSDRISDQQWYKDTCELLVDYPVKKKRMEYLEYKLHRECMPSAKMIATYKEPSFGYDSDLSEEKEILELQVYCKGIELSLDSLSQKERDIIELRYFKSFRDIDAYYQLEIAVATYYKRKDDAISKIAKCIGILKDN